VTQTEDDLAQAGIVECVPGQPPSPPPAVRANDHTPFMSSSSLAPRYFRSKTLTAALAFLFGSLGAHRFYLYGWRDVFGWAHLLGTIVGIPGVLLLVASQRAADLGWWLSIPGAISLLAAFLAAIVYGLRPDEKWDAQFNAETGQHSRSGWTVIFVVIFSLLIGAFLLMSALAISFQTYFESQVEAAKQISQ
jgi:TM2 domain-containing membrane protein YozV